MIYHLHFQEATTVRGWLPGSQKLQPGFLEEWGDDSTEENQMTLEERQYEGAGAGEEEQSEEEEKVSNLAFPRACPQLYFSV